MKLQNLKITNFRNLSTVSVELDQHINIFHGRNGSGKTSCLEAIHYLSLGRSFRTRQLTRLVKHDAAGFTLVGQLAAETGATLSVGIEKQIDATSTIRIGSKPASSLIEIAKLLPIQCLDADSHQLLTSGSLPRRQFLDWGVFHVEPSFYGYWQRAARILKQRNAGLKSATRYSEITHWDEELSVCANYLHQYRHQYLQSWLPCFNQITECLMPNVTLNLNYYSGWPKEANLAELLRENFVKDRQAGFTKYGPQRADLKITKNHTPAAEVLSQGQQKLLAYALRLSQGQLFMGNTGQGCLFLIDDLPSELDSEKRQLVANIIEQSCAQAFITGIEATSFTDLLKNTPKMFHVEHGVVS